MNYNIWTASFGNSINLRVQSKHKKLEKQNEDNFLYFIIVTEFGKPATKIKTNE